MSGWVETYLPDDRARAEWPAAAKVVDTRLDAVRLIDLALVADGLEVFRRLEETPAVLANDHVAVRVLLVRLHDRRVDV